MEVGTTCRIVVEDPSQVSEARRAAAKMAQLTGLPESESGKVAIVVTELATNLLKHGGGGEIIVDGRFPNAGSLTVFALDKGHGIASVRESMRDGHSTTGTAGGGLGAVSRLSSAIDIYSVLERGTAVWAVFREGEAQPISGLTVGGLCVPVKGETLCGDAWTAHSRKDSQMTIMVADGLGHGPGAAQASGRAVEIFGRNRNADPKTLIEAIHMGLHNTRGAAVAVASLDTSRGEVVFAGVGNISGVIVHTDGKQQSMVSHNGTAGMQQVLGNITEFRYPFPAGALAIFHSDGLGTRWKLGAYPGISKAEPALLSAVLYRDFTRLRDDVTVVTARSAA